jgi:hypothetical protein
MVRALQYESWALPLAIAEMHVALGGAVFGGMLGATLLGLWLTRASASSSRIWQRAGRLLPRGRPGPPPLGAQDARSHPPPGRTIMPPVRRCLPVLGLAVVLAACSQFVVSSRHDPDVSFAPLRAFAWLPADDAIERVRDSSFDERIRTAVDRQLLAKGFVPATDGRPDFLLDYRWSTNPVSAVRSRPSRVGWDDLRMHWAGSRGYYAESYNRGSLFVGVLSPETQHPMWVGVAEARVLSTISYERTLKRIDAAVADILADFPPD